MTQDSTSHLTLPVVYLAGPIQGCTKEEMWDWRLQIANLAKNLWKCINPVDMDAEKEQFIPYDKECITQKADGLLVHLDRPSMGTAMEILIAYELKLPIVTVTTIPLSPWVEYHCTMAPNLLEGIFRLTELMPLLHRNR